MPKLNLPLKGACRCGHVRIEVSAPPLLTLACHCTGCQRMSGSAYSLSAAVPTEGFKVVQGSPVIGGANPDAGHHFCPDCLSWLFTQSKGMDFFVNLRPTTLDDTSWFSPLVETYTSEKLEWATTPAKHSFEKFPLMEAFGALIAEYQAM
ncbi:GFA family protein [Pararhizobium sp.]|uniref:GFA family protein n=1 Tax=Pararhizobium sp. TaxID=1977563 RepID=UPI00271F2EAB|nr:GFA family protein [Pararhizobium sp.]MDO9414718.1 GFA family protein [Pararhizobium sp.]